MIRVDVERIADSCGYGVPLMSFEGERRNSRAWAEGKLAKGGPNALEDYVAQRNAESIDGLPAVRRAPPRACSPRSVRPQGVHAHAVTWLRRVRRRPARLTAADVDD